MAGKFDLILRFIMDKKAQIMDFFNSLICGAFAPKYSWNFTPEFDNKNKAKIGGGNMMSEEPILGGNKNAKTPQNSPQEEGQIFANEHPENSGKNGAVFDLKKELQDCVSIFSIKIKKLYRKIRQQNRRIYYLEQENKRLRQLAFLDDLTQLANRRKFYLYLKQQWRGSRGRPTSLILGDVDFFKAYNDNYGHLAGDLCLQQIAEAIQEALKGQNESREYLAARYGGEEFAIVLPETELKDAIAIAEKIRLNIVAKKIPHIGSKIRPWITLSAGVSTQKGGDNLSPETLILAADRALYQAKNNGRDRVCSDT